MVDNALQRHLNAIEISSGQGSTVAFFDVDRTLISGYSILSMARERVRQGVGSGELRASISVLRDLLRSPDVTRSGHHSGNYTRLARRLAKSLKGTPEEAMVILGEQAYRNSIAKELYREAILVVEAHRAAGHHLVIVSAASSYQIAPIARVLGIEEVRCTRLEIVGDHFSGKIIAPLCFSEGKTLAARSSCKQFNASLSSSWFYSDSSDDLPLLRAVGNPVAVNASRTLKAYASANKWKQLNFESRGRPGAEAVVRTALTAQTLAATTAACALGKRFRIGRTVNANRMTQIMGQVGYGFAGLDIEIEGADNLVRDKPAVFIFNHQSLLDSLVLAHLLRRDVVALCKKEMANNPLVGALLRQVDTIFVDRAENDQSEVLRKGLDVLASGRSLVIAPEGTRSTLGEIQPFKHGAFFLAKKAKVPVVPIILHNVKDALPKGGLLIRPTTIRVTVLPSMHPASMGGVRSACEKMERAYARILGNSPVAALPYAAIRKAS